MTPQGRTEEAVRGLLEAAPDAIVLVDASGCIVPTAARWEFGLELAGRRKDGTEIPVEISLGPLETDRGTLIVAAVRDTTVRTHTRRALRAAVAELEAFTYSVSHDLRAPIRQIDGFGRLLEEHSADVLDERGRRYLGRIRDGASRMGRLVDDLLSLARIGRQDLQPVRIDLGGLVSEVVDEVTAEAPSRDIAWHVAPLPHVMCDPGLMRIALTNLLSNAVKYTRLTPHARIDVEQRQNDGDSAIVVRDNGVGFDMQYADKLFGVFQRLHREEEFEGQGVGLATVQRIIHKHGGRVWAEARPGEGASFYFTLPDRGSFLERR